MGKERLLILDGHSLMYRAFHALPLLTNSEGLHTNAVYGFANMLLRMKEEIKPDYIVAAFDRKAPTFRHEEYKDYKAGRKPMPDELSEQFPVIKDMLKLLAIDTFEIDGFEADDLIGTLSKFAEDRGIEVYVVTGDRDALQLASQNIKIVINKKGMTEKEIYDEKRMVDELGVTPKQFIDVKGLMGDTSDNIPGVPGIGEKTAFKLIHEFGSIENVLQNIDNIKGNKIKENLLNYSEQAIFSKKLATIMTDVPVEIDLESIKSKENFDEEGLRNLFMRLQFKSLLARIPENKEETELNEDKNKAEYTMIDNIEKFNSFKVNSEKIYLLYSVENENTYSKLKINKLYINSDNKNYIILLDKILEENAEAAVKKLKSIFEDESLKKSGYDLKNLYKALDKLSVNLKGVSFDIRIAAYLLNPSRGEYNIRTIYQDFLRIDIPYDNDENIVRNLSHLPEIHELLEKNLNDNDMKDLFYKVEMPLVNVLASMESEGFKVDKGILDEIGIKLENEISNVQREIYGLADEEFNISSPKQLGKILFEKLDLPAKKKTKTGYSTNAEVLEDLADKHPIIEKIIYYRQLTKLYSTYVEGLKAVIDTDSRIHSNFNQTVTTTGRLSSTEPNLQNIPVKYELGKEIRKVFIPDDKDSIILSADYSQIELRILAHISGDENLISAFKNHVDIHTKTASEVFKVPVDEVTHIMRSRAKAVNFGIVYGIGDFSLAKDLKISKKEAKMYIDTYFERYPDVKRYTEEIVREAKNTGYVKTILNRRRYITEISSSNRIVEALGERLAMNTPIQGSAADVIKLAMVNVYKRLNESKLKSKLILQVHDELILNVCMDEMDAVNTIVKDEMEKVMKLNVPLEVDINTGDNWYDAK